MTRVDLDHPGHFSFLRALHLADVLTLANGACGIGSVLHTIGFAQAAALGDHTSARLHLAAALALLPVALVLDFLDGRIARAREVASPLGKELDSLADLISFGVAPAAIAFAAGLDRALDVVALVFFALCGLARLARYNVTAGSLADASGKVSHFEGTPITFGLLPAAATVFLAHEGWLVPLAHAPVHLTSLLFVASGCLMVSRTVKIPKP